jgi:hypothetical protein
MLLMVFQNVPRALRRVWLRMSAFYRYGIMSYSAHDF